jgi:hypothetical protein
LSYGWITGGSGSGIPNSSSFILTHVFPLTI